MKNKPSPKPHKKAKPKPKKKPQGLPNESYEDYLKREIDNADNPMGD
jgi:hypothetical protein